MAAWAPASAVERDAPFTRRADLGIRRRSNWLQLVKFALVGSSGYAVNLAVFSALLLAHVQFRLAAVGAFVVAVSNNYTWNRAWTFRGQRGHVGYQGLRFLAVSTVVLGGNVLFLTLFVSAGVGKLPAQAAAIVLVTPLNFLGQKLWSFRS